MFGVEPTEVLNWETDDSLQNVRRTRFEPSATETFNIITSFLDVSRCGRLLDSNHFLTRSSSIRNCVRLRDRLVMRSHRSWRGRWRKPFVNASRVLTLDRQLLFSE